MTGTVSVLHWFVGPQLSSVPGTELGTWSFSVNTNWVLSLEPSGPST